MEYQEIIKLLDAGYTKEEIMKMEDGVSGLNSVDDPKNPDTKDPDTKDPDNKDSDPKKPDQKEPDPAQFMSEAIKEMTEAFADIRKEIQAANIMAARQAPEVQTTSEDIIASIINPFKREKGDK